MNMEELRDHLAARRAAKSPEERAEEDREFEESERVLVASQSAWALHKLGLSDTPEDRWTQKVRMFNTLGVHDFFTGPGPLLIETYGEKPGRTTSTVEPHTPVLSHSLEALRNAIQIAGLTGKIQLTMHEVRRNGSAYLYPHLSVLEWDLVPKVLQERINRRGDHRYLPNFGHRSSIEGVLNSVHDSAASNNWGQNGIFITVVLRDETHPLHAPLFETLRAVSTDTIPVWPAFACVKPDEEYITYDLTYDDIPQWPETKFEVAKGSTVVDLLDKGVVVAWPPTGKHVRVRLDRHEHIKPAEWQCYPAGASVLHIEPTEDPLTATTQVCTDLQVFGRGRSQQDDCIPTVPGYTTVCLLTWTDPADFTITITVSVNPKGDPAFAWADTSAT